MNNILVIDESMQSVEKFVTMDEAKKKFNALVLLGHTIGLWKEDKLGILHLVDSFSKAW